MMTAPITTATNISPRRDPLAEISNGAVVQFVDSGSPHGSSLVVDLHAAHITVDEFGVTARDGSFTWVWTFGELAAVVHGDTDTWTLLEVPGVAGFGVRVPRHRAAEFRSLIDVLSPTSVAAPAAVTDTVPSVPVAPPAEPQPVDIDVIEALSLDSAEISDSLRGLLGSLKDVTDATRGGTAVIETSATVVDAAPASVAVTEPAGAIDAAPTPSGALAGIDARSISAWFGTHMVLDRVSLEMPAGEVTALIGPSGCGKSTFLRILNRMHEMIPSAAMAGEVLVDGHDIYDAQRKVTDARREVGMVFQKPNPFPAMSIYDNVLASFQLTGVKATTSEKDAIVESCLTKAGLWNEVRDRLRKPGGGLSGGQQQRLCIARALAIRPRVLLMDEPCSALDPTSTRRIEETIIDLVSEVTIVIVTHNMQQAARVSNKCAFFLAEQGKPGYIVEHGPTATMFSLPQDPRTNDYVNGRFG